MKLAIMLTLAAVLAPSIVNAGPPSPGAGPSRGRPRPPQSIPNPPPNPLRTGSDGQVYLPSQIKSGSYLTPTPVPTLRKVSDVSDLEVTIQPGENSYTLHVVSTLPIRALAASNRVDGAEMAAVKLDDDIDFTVEVHGQPSASVAVTLDVNTGYFHGKQVIKKMVFDLLEAAPAGADQSPDAKANP